MTKCPGGTYQPNNGSDTCLGCEKGYYCPEGSTSMI
jgi:hypothetical protein